MFNSLKKSVVSQKLYLKLEFQTHFGEAFLDMTQVQHFGLEITIRLKVKIDSGLTSQILLLGNLTAT